MFGILTFDGSIWPKNPGGHAGWGFVLMIPGQPYTRRCGYIGHGDGMTNNVAEYEGLINGMAMAKAAGVKSLSVRGDSQLVINQMKGEWACCAPLLVPLKKKADCLKTMFEQVKFAWNEREENTASDDLSKMGVLMREAAYDIVFAKDGKEMRNRVLGGIVDGLMGLRVGEAMCKADSEGYVWKIEAI